MATALKTCPKCGLAGGPADFYRDKSKPDGLTSLCRSCKRSGNSASYRRHRPRNLERQRAYNATRREKHTQYARQHYARNRERYQALKARWYREHREEVIARVKEWRRNNRDRRRAHDARRRAAEAGIQASTLSRAVLNARWDYYGGRCWICGAEADTWDHVKPLASGGAHLPVNLRPACRPCNSGKRDRWPFEVRRGG